MKLFDNWKSFVLIILAIAGIAVPVWLFNTDLSSKSLSLKLITRVSLQPEEQRFIPGMEISIDGSRLENPHIVVFEVRNDGRKPISSTDFESPLDIRLESKTSFVYSRVTGKIPKDIEANISSERQQISLKPTLLNPKDTITITAITSGAPPIFGSKARIVGISAVSLVDSTNEKTSKATLVLLLSSSVLLLVAFALVIDSVIKPKGIFLRRRAAAIVGLASGIPGVAIFDTFLKEIGIQGFWYVLVSWMILMIPVMFIAVVLNQPQIEILYEEPSSEKS